ncbi:membrane-bound lytic murein transglycosylase MltF [Motiliproteus sp. SC1-56]|uniref:membrane-bound lytic murein transglycosylase MltF n=1 Tax=Motiliproteus sp. SC1-56 TaxID=2799565 RepID=UPI001A9034C6|nr:membrane-bound lytic murein transglycosylase MltF [Motiliproteus sp. SC1-56]
MLSHRPFQPKDSLFLLTGLVLFCIPILASYNASSQLDVIRQQGELRIVTRLSPASYFLTDQGPGGFEYELSKAYADHLGVNIAITLADDMEQIYKELRLHNSHLAAAGLTPTPERRQHFTFSDNYLQSRPLLIYRTGDGGPVPRSLAEVNLERLAVIAGSSHEEQLKALLPDDNAWQSVNNLEMVDLLEQVHSGELDYTLVDSTEFDANRAFFPRLQVAFPLTETQPLAWMLKKSGDGSLKNSINRFLALPETQALIARLAKTYYEQDRRLNLVDNLTFRQHLRTRLPELRPWFEEAEAETGIDWKLLAAIGYQESHWNPRAVSPTGVRGVMMLTRHTAREMGVKKRTDAEQSILGGARYFKKLHSRLPERIEEPDRTWLALAAYNVGRGHLEDARILTQRTGQDPDRWADVAEQLPKLSQAKWYKTVRHGYARGREPVVYVRNIRRYLEQLAWESRFQAVQNTPVPQASEAVGPPARLPDTL